MKIKALAIILFVSGLILVFYGAGFIKSTKEAVVGTAIEKSDFKFSFSKPKDKEAAVPTPMATDDRNQEHHLVAPIRERYNNLKKCEDTESSVEQEKCLGAVVNDYAVYKRELLTNFRTELNMYIKDLKEGRAQLVYDDMLLARELLLNEDRSDIQQAALQLIAQFPPDDENLNVLEVVLATTMEPEVVEQGLNILELYQDVPDFNDTFDLVVQEQIRLSSREDILPIVGRALLKFMTPQRFQSYQDFYFELENLKKKSRAPAAAASRVLDAKLQFLNSVLREYQTYK